MVTSLGYYLFYVFWVLVNEILYDCKKCSYNESSTVSKFSVFVWFLCLIIFLWTMIMWANWGICFNSQQWSVTFFRVLQHIEDMPCHVSQKRLIEKLILTCGRYKVHYVLMLYRTLSERTIPSSMNNLVTSRKNCSKHRIY